MCAAQESSQAAKLIKCQSDKSGLRHAQNKHDGPEGGRMVLLADREPSAIALVQAQPERVTPGDSQRTGNKSNFKIAVHGRPGTLELKASAGQKLYCSDRPISRGAIGMHCSTPEVPGVGEGCRWAPNSAHR